MIEMIDEVTRVLEVTVTRSLVSCDVYSAVWKSTSRVTGEGMEALYCYYTVYNEGGGAAFLGGTWSDSAAYKAPQYNLKKNLYCFPVSPHPDLPIQSCLLESILVYLST